MQISPIAVPTVTTAAAPAATKPALDFGEMLGRAVGELDALQKQSDDLAMRLADGQAVDLHDVVLATEEASLAFQLAIQVRNRVVEAYQEIMRMQV